jgi:hypothetical protein
VANGVNELGLYDKFSSREDEESAMEWHKKIAVPVQWYVSLLNSVPAISYNKIFHPHKN